MRVSLGLALLGLCFMAHRAQAQPGQTGATLRMTADRTSLGLGESLRLQIRADVTNADGNGLRLPNLDAFRIVEQRVSRPMQFSFGFGSQRQLIQSSVVYDMSLEPLSEGALEIEPASITVSGQTYRSNTLTIQVGAGVPGQTPPTPTSTLGVPPTGPLTGAEYDADGFIRTVVDNPAPYVGQQVTVTVFLYVRGQLRGPPSALREPATDGFWVHDLLAQRQTIPDTTQSINGVTYRVYALRHFAAFPLEPGPLQIGPMSLSFQTGSGLNFFNTRPSQSFRRDGIPVPVEAKPLPEAGAPGGDVHVGSYQLDVTAEPSQVATGDAVTLRAVATGTGNPRDLSLTLPPLDGLRILEPQIRDEVTLQGDAVGGSRTWEWLVVPEREGRYPIPSLELHTFDPRTETYRTVRSEPIELQAAGNAVVAVDDTAPAEGPGEALAEDEAPTFGPIRRESALERGAEPFAGSAAFWLLLAFPPVAFLVALALSVLRRRRSQARERGAPDRQVRDAKRRLGAASGLAQTGDATAFYGEIELVLRSVLEARLGAPVGGFTHRELRDHLKEQGMEEDLTRRVVDEL